MKAEAQSFKAIELPALPLDTWADTLATVHMWTQIVGKVRLKLCPLVNHWWNVPLYLTGRGLTTSLMPYGGEAVEISFDFIDHKLKVETCEAGFREISLRPESVAEFYRQVMAAMSELGVPVKIWTMPQEVADPIRFEKDEQHKSYDAEAMHKFWRILAWVDGVFKDFRAPFLGKVSPVHFFWGSFDLAVTRFSGRRAPERPGADAVLRAEAYSHEVQQRRFLGWRGRHQRTGILFLRLPGACRLW